MSKKIISTLIVLSLLLIICISCSSKNEDNLSSDTNIGNTEDENSAAETDEFFDRKNIKDNIGQYNFDGKNFSVVLSTQQMEEPYFTEDYNGDLVNDAVYDRTLTIEDRFNVKIKHTDTGGNWNEVSEAVRISVAASDDAYDLGVAHTFIGLTGLMTSGALFNWNELPVADLEKPWWNPTAIENLSINGVLLTASGDYVYQRPMVTYFNKDMVENYNISNPYQLVTDGKWTWNKLSDLAKVVSDDLNGDGKYDDKDQYGYSHMIGWQTISVVTSMGMGLTVRNDEGYPRLDNYTTDKMVSIVQKIYDLFYTDERTYLPVWESYMGALGGYTNLFGNGQILFLHSNTELLQMFREIEIDFGMLPLPKYDEEQKDYRVLCDTQVLIIPVYIKDPEFTGVICEALSVESYRNVVPAVYEITFENKYLRDEESYRMFNIIRSGIVYEFGWTYGEGNEMIYALPNLMSQKSTDLISYYEKRYKNIEKQFEKVINKVIDNYCQ